MNEIFEKVAMEKGLTTDEVIDIFSIFTMFILSKVPQLKYVIEDISINADPDKLKEHINNMIAVFQMHNEDVFKTWTMPESSYIFRQNENAPLF